MPTRLLYGKILSLFIVLLMIAGNNYAQIGVRVDYLHQDNYLDEFFNPGVMPQLVYTAPNKNGGKVLSMVGLGVSKLKPRAETVPEYQTILQPDGSEAIVPDDRKWKKTWQMYFYGDLNFRVFKLGNLGGYAGPGINIGMGRLNYERPQRIPVESVDGLVAYFGLRLNASLLYDLPENFQVAITATKNFMKGTAYEGYSSTAIGLGIYYTIED